VKPLGDARPAWKVIRALGSLLESPGFLYNSAEEVLGDAIAKPIEQIVNNQFTAEMRLSTSLTQSNASVERISDLPIYSSDAIVRRAAALQLTRDAKQAMKVGLGTQLFTQFNLKEGDLIQLAQEGSAIQVPATLESNLADGVVRVSAGGEIAAQLGAMFGPVTISPVVRGSV
jgi:NADH-quinone oxidoreductase subunit G